MRYRSQRGTGPELNLIGLYCDFVLEILLYKTLSGTGAVPDNSLVGRERGEIVVACRAPVLCHYIMTIDNFVTDL